MRITNQYDYKSRRIAKRVETFDGESWALLREHSFVYDEWNLIFETIENSDGVKREIQYFWGNDLSGTLHDAGGVGGLVAISMKGNFYLPLYDNNGNILNYIDENGSVVASYIYDTFGNLLEKSGVLAEDFKIRFSTKYYDDETSFYYYGYRFYSPNLGRWLNRDPIEEKGGINVYAFCKNNSIDGYDKLGQAYFAYRPLDVFCVRELELILFNFSVFDKSNRVLAHEQLFFEDNGIPNNLGFFNDNEVRPDNTYQSYKIAHSKNWDDCIMRKAVKLVIPARYSLFGGGGLRQYNCQDWAEEVREAYKIISYGLNYKSPRIPGLWSQ